MSLSWTEQTVAGLSVGQSRSSCCSDGAAAAAVFDRVTRGGCPGRPSCPIRWRRWSAHSCDFGSDSSASGVTLCAPTNRAHQALPVQQHRREQHAALDDMPRLTEFRVHRASVTTVSQPRECAMRPLDAADVRPQRAMPLARADGSEVMHDHARPHKVHAVQQSASRRHAVQTCC